MPRINIRDFSGGLTSNRSEFDIESNEYQTFSNISNKVPGRVERPKDEQAVSPTITRINQDAELISYRTEKDENNNDTSTEWWVVGYGTDAKRSDVADGVGGTWTGLGLSYTGSPVFDFLVHNQALRIADGSFTNVSKWYGHIKRDILGNNLGLQSANAMPRYASPAHKQELNTWALENTELASPTIVKMGMAHDGNSDLSNNDDVGIFVYDPRHGYGTNSDIENDEHNAWDNAMSNETFDPADRYAVTYLYDYVQESELSRDADGNIGVSGFEVVDGSDDEAASGASLSSAITNTAASFTLSGGAESLFNEYTYILLDKEVMFIKNISGSTIHVRRGQLNTQSKDHQSGTEIFYRSSPQKARAINLVLNGIDANGYHNKRITGINLYWQPKGDPDWYLVETLDMNRGYADSPLATSPDTQYPKSSNEAKFYSSNNYHNTAMKNYGHWMPCPNPTTVDDTSSESFSFSSSAWTGASGSFDNTGANDICIASRQETGDTSLTTQFNRLGAYHGYTTSASSTTLTFGADKNINRVFSKKINTTANVATTNRITTHNEVTSKVTTWYIPFDGLKLATYNALTGRSEKTKVQAIKWNTSTVAFNRGYYADIDTKDDNDQTAREKNRIYFTDPFKLDEIVPGRFFDVGRNDGDEIVKLITFRDKIFVFKTRNTYIYNAKHQLERHYVGVGAIHKHSVIDTPMGLVCANAQQVAVVGLNNVTDLTLKIRDTWQGLTLNEPKIGYDAIENELIVVYDYSDSNCYVFNLNNGSWLKRAYTAGDDASNFITSSGLRAQLFIG